MEITELLSFYLNETTQILEVTFRTTSDSDEESRESKINYEEIEEFGYGFVSNQDDSLSILDEEYDENEEFDDFENTFVDEEEIISFLNEYYSLYPSKLPNSEPF
jgi:hypothetical protein